VSPACARDRELPVIWAVAKGALLNKVILVPAALLISAFVPRAITPLLMAGGLFSASRGSRFPAEGLW
jgi:predicted DNA repair protein MutK